MAQPGRWQHWLLAQWRGPTPTLAARLLQPLSWLYAALAALHRGLYRSGLVKAQAAPRPLIVVGNLVAGGAGKTPAVMAIVQWLQREGWHPGVLSRGHGRSATQPMLVGGDSTATEVGDEPLLIHRRCACPVAVGADRAQAAHLLCQQHPVVDILVADDGLQHHRLRRDLEVLLFDKRGAGNGLRLPAGPLREPLPALVGPQRLVLYTAGQRSTTLPGHLGQRHAAGVLPLQDWWRDPLAPLAPLHSLAGRSLLAVAGLAQPQAFFDMLHSAGLQIRPWPLADHHPMQPLPWPPDAPEVILTEKDAVKLPLQQVGTSRVWVVRLDFTPEPAFFDALAAQLARFASPGTSAASPSPAHAAPRFHDPR